MIIRVLVKFARSKCVKKKKENKFLLILLLQYGIEVERSCGRRFRCDRRIVSLFTNSLTKFEINKKDTNDVEREREQKKIDAIRI